MPILLALVLLTLADVFGGRLMTLIKKPPVLGELVVGLLIGNLPYWFGSAGHRRKMKLRWSSELRSRRAEA